VCHPSLVRGLMHTALEGEGINDAGVCNPPPPVIPSHPQTTWEQPAPGRGGGGVEG
jgi:hypothetical protein